MASLTATQQAALAATGSYSWTSGAIAQPFRPVAFSDLVDRVIGLLDADHIVVPNAAQFVRRAVAGLLAGHIILQGPPGTGKTTIAKILAQAFEAELRIVTATSEWSTYDVIGGLQPSVAGGFAPLLGAVPKAVLDCAQLVLDDSTGAAPHQAAWLLIDEFNRADIDKAIGPLYTVLSSTAAADLQRTPLELWFESGVRRQLWVPSRFRIIGTMNDVDTSFVNAMSQGLTRRFQFISLLPAVGDAAVEVDAAFSQAAKRWQSERGTAIQGDYRTVVSALSKMVEELRDPKTIGWPLGTAQVLDVIRATFIRTDGDEGNLTGPKVLDEAIADIIVPQAGNLTIPKLESIRKLFESTAFPIAAKAVLHIENTSVTQL